MISLLFRRSHGASNSRCATKEKRVTAGAGGVDLGERDHALCDSPARIGATPLSPTRSRAPTLGRQEGLSEAAVDHDWGGRRRAGTLTLVLAFVARRGWRTVPRTRPPAGHGYETAPRSLITGLKTGEAAAIMMGPIVTLGSTASVRHDP